MKQDASSIASVNADKSADAGDDTTLKLVASEDRAGNDKTRYFIDDESFLYKEEAGKNDLIANFYATIQSQDMRVDEGTVKGRVFHLLLHRKGMEDIPFALDEADFMSNKLHDNVLEIGGHKTILYGRAKDLALAAQELSETTIQETVLSTSIGFDPTGAYFTQGMAITQDKGPTQGGHQFDLSGSRFARNLAFNYPAPDTLTAAALNIYSHFLRLKSPSVIYPLIGHICLAPFTSQISVITGRKKYVLHMQGPSGCGKLFIATLANSFFGTFHDHLMSWASTKNAIEMEGYYFRDSLYVVDDFKTGLTNPKVFVEIIQHYADGHGRSRLTPGGKMGDLYAIRGLLLSTGEDFVSDIESVSARTILIKAEPTVNTIDGLECWQSHHIYKTFLPYLIGLVISNDGWKDDFSGFVNAYTEELLKDLTGLSNGMRLASNWALNAWGFTQFITVLGQLGIIDDGESEAMREEYNGIALTNLKDHAARLIQQNPINVFFEAIGQAIAAGEARLYGMDGTLRTGTPIGILKPETNAVCIVPDLALQILLSRFRATGQRIPFTKILLRGALADQGMIVKVKEGRWTVQVRFPDGTRHQAWEIGLDEFKQRVGI